MSEIVRAAREWIGTPFHHQARVRGAGVDCIGLLMGVAKDSGRGRYDFVAYERSPNPKVLMTEVNQYLTQTREMREGSVLLFRILKDPQHFAIYTGAERNTIIHAYSTAGKVIEEPYDSIWQRRLLGIYEFKDHYE